MAENYGWNVYGKSCFVKLPDISGLVCNVRGKLPLHKLDRRLLRLCELDHPDVPKKKVEINAPKRKRFSHEDASKVKSLTIKKVKNLQEPEETKKKIKGTRRGSRPVNEPEPLVSTIDQRRNSYISMTAKSNDNPLGFPILKPEVKNRHKESLSRLNKQRLANNPDR